MRNTATTQHGLWLAVILLTGIVAAVLGGTAFWLVGGDVAAALATGGGTFLGVTSLGMAMRKFLSDASG